LDVTNAISQSVALLAISAIMLVARASGDAQPQKIIATQQNTAAASTGKNLPKWTRVFHSRHCEAMICGGESGFSVDQQGRFVAGPNRSGKAAKGEITPEELRILQNDTNNVIRELISPTPGACERLVWARPGVGSEIEITLEDNSVRAISTMSAIQDDHTCGTVGANELTKEMGALITKYWPH
jgi:hypothetical protein